MKMKPNLCAAAMLFGLGFAGAGCVAGSDADAPLQREGEESVAEVSQADWTWTDPSRGWVDRITRTCKNTFCIGPGPAFREPGEFKIEGWACLKPPSVQPFLSLVVYQGGPPGSGTAVSILGFEVQKRQNVVDYGACANVDNGFGIWVDALPNLQKVFYVTYVTNYPTVLLGGATVPDREW